MCHNFFTVYWECCHENGDWTSVMAFVLCTLSRRSCEGSPWTFWEEANDCEPPSDHDLWELLKLCGHKRPTKITFFKYNKPKKEPFVGSPGLFRVFVGRSHHYPSGFRLMLMDGWWMDRCSRQICSRCLFTSTTEAVLQVRKPMNLHIFPRSPDHEHGFSHQFSWCIFS